MAVFIHQKHQYNPYFKTVILSYLKLGTV